MKKKVIVGMSGGVDSTVAAILLKNQGYDVTGVFMKVWDEKHKIKCGTKSSCYGPEEKDIEELERISKTIDIPVIFIDLKKEFHHTVIEYFKKEYLEGKTPNPCVICNKFVKFGFLLNKINEIGIDFDFFATGHYARVEYKNGRYILKKGIDLKKDQSYFLFLLNQQQLSKIIFPLGEYTKPKVKEIAKSCGLDISEKEESQDFISGDRFFLFDKATGGDIIDRNGNILGKHKGIFHYTIGQRRGIGISGKKPLYVIEILPEKNAIVVGEEKELYKKNLIAKNINFISIEKLEKPMKVKTRIRYKHHEAQSEIFPVNSDTVEVIFEKPQRAITPGQAAVFYSGEEVVGGGFIV